MNPSGFGFTGGGSGGGGSGVTATFVYRPGGVAGGTVFTSWPALYAALVALTGAAATIVIDDSIVSPAVIPAGTYAMDQVLLQGVPNRTTFSGGAALELAVGARFTLGTLYITSLDVTYVDPAVPCATVAAGEMNLYANDLSLICTGGGPFVAVTGGNAYLQLEATNVGDGVHPAVSAAGAGTVFIFGLLATAINANATAGAGVTISYDDSSLVVLPQGGASLFLLSQADTVNFAPAVPANWLVPPTQVAQALNELAARPSGITTSFVYRSGGGTGTNVYGTWPLLMAAMNSAAIQAGTVRFLALDGSNGALHATVGAWNVDNFRITTTAAGSGFATHLTIDDGCVLQGHTLYVSDGATLISQSSSTVWETTTADEIVLSERASIQNAVGTAPFFHAYPGRSFTINVESYAALGDGTNPAVNLDDATAHVDLFVFDGGSVLAHALMGTGSYTTTISADGTVGPQDNVGSAAVTVNGPASVNVVTAFGVDPTGAVDAGPILNARYASLTANGQSPWFPPGTYKLTTAAPPPVGMTVWIARAGSVTFTGANAASVANVAFVYGQTPGQASYNPAWYALTDIYLDPVAGLDSNTGMVGSPIKTGNEAARRWGSANPKLGLTTKLHLLTPEPPGTEDISIRPTMVEGANFIVVGTPAAFGAPFAAGAVTAKVRANPGTLLQVAGFTHGETAGMLIHNVTNDSYAFIESMTGTVATMTQPFAAAGLTTPSPAPVFVEDDGWILGNSLQVYVLPTIDLNVFEVSGGDSDAAYSTPVAWLQFVHVSDNSGLVGNSTFGPRPHDGMNMVLSSCWIDPFLYLNGTDTPYVCLDVNCYTPSGSTHIGASMYGGSTNGSLIVPSPEFWDFSLVDYDAILHGPVYFKGGRYCSIGYGYFDAGLVIARTQLRIDAGGQMWGAGSCLVEGPHAALENASLGTWVACLTLGALNIDGLANAYAFDGALVGNPFTLQAITPANLDTYGSLQNPNTQSCYCLPA